MYVFDLSERIGQIEGLVMNGMEYMCFKGGGDRLKGSRLS